MQYEITDAAAIEFARAVYDQIASGSPIDAAIQEARIAISATCRETVEWATPVLHMRSVDGELFDVSFRDAIYGNRRRIPRGNRVVRQELAAPPRLVAEN